MAENDNAHKEMQRAIGRVWEGASGEPDPELVSEVEEFLKRKSSLDPGLVVEDGEGDLSLSRTGEQKKDILASRMSNRGRSLTIEDEKVIRHGDRKEAWDVVKKLLSEIYSKAFMSPNVPFQSSINTMESQGRFSLIQDSVLRSEKHSLFLSKKMSEMQQAAEVIHNASYIVLTNKGKSEEMANLMQAPSTISDVILDMEGVPMTYRLYADYFNQMRMDNLRSRDRLDWIGPQDVYFKWETGKCEIDDKVRETFIIAIESGVFNDNGEKYNRDSLEFKEAWPDSKIDQALHYGRSYGAATAVLVEISGETGLPGEKMTSPFAEDFTRIFGPITHVVDKFGIGRTGAYLYYLFTGEMRTFSSEEEIKHYLSEAIDIKKIMAMPKEERDKIPNFIWNLTGIDSRSGGWRLKTARAGDDWEGLGDEERRLSGVEVNYEPTRNVENNILLDGKKLQVNLRKNQETWDLVLKRTPLVVLRAMLRFNPELQVEINDAFFEKRETWIETDPKKIKKKITKTHWVKGEKIETEGEVIVKMANKSSAEKIASMERWLLILKEDAVRKGKPELNFDLVPEDDMRKDVKKYRDIIRKVAWDKGYLGGSFSDFDHSNPNRDERIVKSEWLVDTDGDMKKIFPHTTTISDMRFEEHRYIRTGSIGDMGRRWRDIDAASRAKDGFLEFMQEIPHAAKAGDYVEMLKPFFKGMMDFDPPNARKTFAYMAEMIVMANKKLPAYQWMPWGVDKIPSGFGLFPKAKSYAQKIFGSDAACWDKIDAFRFIGDAGTAGFINSLGEKNRAEGIIKDLKIGGNHRALELIVRWGPVGAGFLLYLMISKALKDMEEDLKES